MSPRPGSARPWRPSPPARRPPTPHTGCRPATGRLITALDEVLAKPGSPKVYLVVDEPGIGGGIIDRLQEQGIPVTAYNGGRKAELVANPERFVNRRAAAFWTLRRRLEDGTLALAPDDDLADELTSIRWKVQSDGKIAIELKDQIRQRLGRSRFIRFSISKTVRG